MEIVMLILPLLYLTTPIGPWEGLNKLLIEVWPNYMEPKLSRKFQSTVEVSFCLKLYFVLGCNLVVGSSKGFANNIRLYYMHLIHGSWLCRIKSFQNSFWFCWFEVDSTPAAVDFVVSSACSPATVHLLQLRWDAGAHGGAHGGVPHTVPQLTYWSSTSFLIKLGIILFSFCPVSPTNH